MHTSRGCLGAWGYRGMYAIIAISCLCREQCLKGPKGQRHSTPLNYAWDKKFGAVGAMAPAPLCFKTRGGGGAGGCRIQGPGPAAPPPPRRAAETNCKKMAFGWDTQKPGRSTSALGAICSEASAGTADSPPIHHPRALLGTRGDQVWAQNGE